MMQRDALTEVNSPVVESLPVPASLSALSSHPSLSFVLTSPDQGNA
jgi:hypothetical protein